jgi:hypothetical protein
MILMDRACLLQSLAYHMTVPARLQMISLMLLTETRKPLQMHKLELARHSWGLA